MFKILSKEKINPIITKMVISVPEIAQTAQPGQFIILRVDEQGERIPLTIADFDRQAGTIMIIFQVVGVSTMKLDRLNQGDSVLDVVGPLGQRFDEAEHAKNIVCVGGGVGTACLYPKAKACHQLGRNLTTIIGSRSADLLIFEKELAAISNKLLVATDDGSKGHKGFVSQVLEKVLNEDPVDLVVVVGPLPMMRACSEVTRSRKVKTIVSLNPVMVDGTGMCGGCRVTVAGTIRFACVDGPCFDGHEVDYAELMSRTQRFVALEKEACKLQEQRGQG